MFGVDLNALLTCIDAAWSPRIGDPTLVGWATVAAYAIAGLLSFRAARRGDAAFWIVVGLCLLALAVNKQLDLQSALTATGRCLAKMQGWYENRRGIQEGVILAILGLGALVLLLGLWSIRNRLHRVGLAFFGLIFIAAFVAVRAVGFHGMDELIGTSIAGIRINWLAELSGIALVAINAWWRGRAL